MKFKLFIYAISFYYTLTQSASKKIIANKLKNAVASIKWEAEFWTNTLAEELQGKIIYPRRYIAHPLDKELQLFITTIKWQDKQEHLHIKDSLFLRTGLLSATYLGRINYSYTPHKMAWIDGLYLDEAWRHKGLGQVLLEQSLKELAQNQALHVDLSVGYHNLPAIALYQKCGFKMHQKTTGGMNMRRSLPQNYKS